VAAVQRVRAVPVAFLPYLMTFLACWQNGQVIAIMIHVIVGGTG